MRRAVPRLLLSALLSTAVLVWAAPAGAQQMGEPPGWLLTTDWGLSMHPEVDPASSYTDTAMTGAGGLILTVRERRGHEIVYGDLTLLPLWAGTYSARVGGVIGALTSAHYTEFLGSSGGYNYYMVHPQRIHMVLGLDGAISARYFRGDQGGATAVLEGGFGLVGQHVIEIGGLYDLGNGTPGLRMHMVYALGDGSFTVAFRFGLEVFFDYHDHPLPLMMTFGLGGGDGFDYR